MALFALTAMAQPQPTSTKSGRNKTIATPAIALPIAQPTKFNLVGVRVADVMQVIFGEALKTSFVLDPDVANDQRTISFRWSAENGDIHAFLNRFLDSLGYSVDNRSGVDFVARKKESELPAADVFIYRPMYREVSFLTELLSPLFKGGFTLNRTVATPEGSKLPQGKSPPPNSAAALIDRSSDILVFTGSNVEIERLKKLLPQVDFARGEVSVRGIVYEVSTTDTQGSAFGLLASILGGKLSAGIGSTLSNGSFLRFKGFNIDGVYSMLSQDSRFKVVSSPSLRVRSGSAGSFSVGQDVPVIGSVTYPANGQAVQSVEYRSSGVLFNLQPTVREGVIDLLVDQQLSNFTKTTTGVNNSPTLIKRALRTTVGVEDGDIVVLGGLTENKSTDTRDGISFLPKILHTTGTDASKTEILLVMQVTKI